METANGLDSWRSQVLDTLRADVGAEEAQQTDDAPESDRRIEVLAFGLGEETYGVNIGEVAEILIPRPVTALPRTPAFIRGLVSLRGTVLPVVDLAARLGIGVGKSTSASRILVLRDGEERMGFWVDRVNGVVRFAPGEVESTDFTCAVEPCYINGIGYDRRGTLVAVLCGEKLCDFSLEEA